MQLQYVDDFSSGMQPVHQYRTEGDTHLKVVHGSHAVADSRTTWVLVIYFSVSEIGLRNLCF